MPIKHRIQLTVQEREQLMNILRKKHGAAARQAHARILLKADEHGPEGGLPDADTALAVEVSLATVERVRRRFVEDGWTAALERKATQVSSGSSSRCSKSRLLQAELNALD